MAHEKIKNTPKELLNTSKDLYESGKSKLKEKKDKDQIIKSEVSIPRLNKTIIAPPIPKIGGEKIISFYLKIILSKLIGYIYLNSSSVGYLKNYKLDGNLD